MDDPTDEKPCRCPQCGKTTDEDAGFCKYCGFALTAPAVSPNASSAIRESIVANMTLIVFCLIGVLIVGVGGWIIYMTAGESNRSPVGGINPPALATNSPAALLSPRAQPVEEKILRGEALTVADLFGVPAPELRLLRNAHFARHGRKYTQPELQTYFGSRPWYQPSDAYSDQLLTATDKENVRIILSIEKPETAITESANLDEASGKTGDAVASTANSGDSLSREEMLNLMRRNGVWGPMMGWRKYKAYEVLRIGPYNEQNKFYPVQIKVTDRMNDGSMREWIWDCRIIKNDYGDWETKKTGF